MQFTVSSQDFYDKLRLAKHAASGTYANLQVTENVLVEAEENEIIIKATDMEVSLQTRKSVQMAPEMGLDESVVEAKKCVFPLEKVSKTLKNLPDVPVEVTFDTDHQIHLETDQGSYELKGFPAEDFPDLPTLSSEDWMEAKGLEKALDKVDFAVSDDALRPAMMGVYLDADENTVIATDGHQLSMVDFEVSLHESMILMGDGADLMKRVMDDSSVLAILKDRSHAALRNGETTVISRLIDESYPDYQGVIPNENDKKLLVDREEVKAAIERVGIYTSNRSERIKLAISPNQLEVQGEDVERGDEAKEAIRCDFDGEGMEIGFNPAYLSKLLSTIETEEVEISLDEPNTAGLIRPVGENGHTGLLMPVMLESYA